MFRNIQTNDNARRVEARHSLLSNTLYIHPSNPSSVTQSIDGLLVRQNYGPINSTHFAERIYHDQNSKIRFFPTRSQLWNQKDKFPNYDERARVGPQMTRHLMLSERNSAIRQVGWNGYELEPERQILSYDSAVKSLGNIRFSLDQNISIYQDIELFFTRFDTNGVTVDTESLQNFADLENVFVDKEFYRNVLIESPAQFLSELRYNISHGFNASNQDPNRAILPLSIEEPETIPEENEPVYNQDEALRLSNELNDNLFERVTDLENQISELKETIFVKESTITELTSVTSAVLEVNKSSLIKNNLGQSDIIVHDRIFNFLGGVRSQIYKFRENKSFKSRSCDCYQCEIQDVCTKTQKIIKIGLENCNIKPTEFVFGKNVNGHVHEAPNPKDKNIELTEITHKNKFSKNKDPEEAMSVSVNISSHNSRESNCRSVIVDTKHSTPIKQNEPAPKILIQAEIDETTEITRPSFPNSDCSDQMNWTEMISDHEEFLSDN